MLSFVGKVVVVSALLFPAISFGKKFHVIVDPGHGGGDSGAMYDTYREADITLGVAKFLNRKLKKDKTIKVSMTRTKNKTVSLWTRSDLANDLGGDLFISIHVNSNPNVSTKGAEFYFQSQLPPDEEALFLANRENFYRQRFGEEETEKPDVLAIVDDMKRSANILNSYEFTKDLKNNWKNHFKMRRRSIRQAPFHVLAEVNMPSVLIELGFITNRAEARWLSKKKNQNYLASVIYKGIKRYQERMDKSNGQSHIKAYAKR